MSNLVLFSHEHHILLITFYQFNVRALLRGRPMKYLMRSTVYQLHAVPASVTHAVSALNSRSPPLTWKEAVSLQAENLPEFNTVRCPQTSCACRLPVAVLTRLRICFHLRSKTSQCSGSTKLFSSLVILDCPLLRLSPLLLTSSRSSSSRISMICRGYLVSMPAR